MANKPTFKLTVMNPDALLFEDNVFSVFISGDRGEYEILPYHYPILGALKTGDIIINWEHTIPIKKGVVRFFANDCIILVEQEAKFNKQAGPKKEDPEDEEF